MTGVNPKNIYYRFRSRPRPGYSLVELIVAVSIFAIAFVTIAAIFVGFSLSQSRAGQSQRLLSEGNYILESIAREVRMNAVAYSCGCYNPATQTDYICLTSESGQRTHFYYDGSPGAQKIYLLKDTVGTGCANNSYPALNPDFIKVTNFSLRTIPSSAPQAVDAPASAVYQPITIINLSVETGSGKNFIHYDFQTAVSSRYYGL